MLYNEWQDNYIAVSAKQICTNIRGWLNNILTLKLWMSDW